MKFVWIIKSKFTYSSDNLAQSITFPVSLQFPLEPDLGWEFQLEHGFQVPMKSLRSQEIFWEPHYHDKIMTGLSVTFPVNRDNFPLIIKINIIIDSITFMFWEQYLAAKYLPNPSGFNNIKIISHLNWFTGFPFKSSTASQIGIYWNC